MGAEHVFICKGILKLWRDFPGGPVVNTVGDTDLIPGQGTKILYAKWCSQKKKKKNLDDVYDD